MHSALLDFQNELLEDAQMVPLWKANIGPAQEAAVLSALRAGHIGGNGPECRRLEAEILSMLGGEGHLLAVGSGSAALEIAARLLPPGTEVLVPAFTFVTAASAMLRAGLRVRFCDVDPQTGNCTAAHLEAVATQETSAVMVMHYAGFSCEMGPILELARRKGWKLIEDAAHALGGRWEEHSLGTLGDLGCFSLHASKEVPAGEGGLLWCKQAEMAKRGGIFREKGTNRDDWIAGVVPDYQWLELGTSDTLADPLAALARSYLPSLETRRQQRALRAEHWRKALSDLPLLLPPVPPPSILPTWHTFPLRVPPQERSAWQERFAAAGITAAPHFPPLHRSPFWQHPQDPLPGVEAYSASLLRLPLHDGVTEDCIENCVSILRAGRWI